MFSGSALAIARCAGRFLKRQKTKVCVQTTRFLFLKILLKVPFLKNERAERKIKHKIYGREIGNLFWHFTFSEPEESTPEAREATINLSHECCSFCLECVNQIIVPNSPLSDKFSTDSRKTCHSKLSLMFFPIFSICNV